MVDVQNIGSVLLRRDALDLLKSAIEIGDVVEARFKTNLGNVMLVFFQ